MSTRFIICLILLLCGSHTAFGLNITIIESQSNNSGHVMDVNWQTVVQGMGHTATIVPQTTLDNTAFFATTDILIVSSGVITLPANRVNTILQFIQSGKSVYLQCEYLSSYTTNQGFATILGALGATFSWGSTISGDLNPMNVLGTFATTNNNVPPLSYFWYSVYGIGDCNTVNFLEYNGVYHGFHYVPFNAAYGTIIATTDQDWVRSSTSNALMENIITHLINTISVNPNAVDLGNDTTLCNGQTLTLNATTPGATGYLWQDNSTNATFTVTTAGTYWVEVTNNCTTVRDTIVVNYSAPGGSVNLGNDTTLCPGQTVTLDATTAGATGYLWQDNTTNPTYTVTTGGIYSVAVSVGCGVVTDTIVVNYIGGGGTVNLGNDTTLCPGNTLLLDATVPAAVSYLWQDNSTNPTFTATTAGTYYVEVDVSCAIVYDTIVVAYDINLNPIDLGNDTTLCLGNTLTLDGTTAGATGYLWQDNTTNATYNVSTSGIYSVTATNYCSTVTDDIVVNYAPGPGTVALGNDTTLCPGQTLSLNAATANAVSYLWQDNSVNPTYTVTTAGTYYVAVDEGCYMLRDTILVAYDVNLAPIDLGNDTTLCLGNTLTLDGTTAGTTGYLWQDNTTNATYNVSTGGIYSITATNYCSTVTDDIVVNYAPGAGTVNLGNDTILCPGQTLSLNAATANAISYLWQDNSVNPTYTVTTAGTYFVAVDEGCYVLRDTIVVSYVTNPANFSLGNDTTLCPGNTLALDATTPGAISYLWEDNSTGPTRSITTSGIYWVNVSTMCTSLTDTVEVNYYIPPAPVDLGNDTMLCSGATLTLDVTAAGATGYLWQDNSTASIYTITTAGTYSVTVTDPCGSTTDDIVVGYIPDVMVDLGNDTMLCTGATITLDATFSGATYLWQDNRAAPTYPVTAAGTYSVTLSNSCSTAFDSIDITYHTPQTLDLGPDTMLCPGQTLSLDATTPNATYLWQDAGTAAIYTVAQAGDYFVEVNDGCDVLTDTVAVQYDVMPVADLGADTTLCMGDVKLLDVTQQNVTYLWQDSSTAATLSVTQEGTYSVSVTANCGTVSDDIYISYDVAPVVNLGADTTVCDGEALVLNATYPNATYTWHDLSSLATFDVSLPGTYWVDVTGQCGAATDTIEVTYDNCECYVLAPSAFSPNGDGNNDRYGVIYNCPVTNYHIMIFNRWGQLVYESQKINQRWEGDFKGDPAPMDAYSFVITYTTNEGQDKSIQGNVTLVR